MPAAPAGLKAFLLRAEEPVTHEFPRTPSFAWRPVRGALRYEFELATSRSFSGGAIIWSNVKADVEEPAAAPPTTSPPTTTPATTAPATAPAASTVDPTRPASVYDDLRSPAVALDLSLPWITGNPYALYAHVRAVTRDGATRWSTPFGLNIRWGTVPADLDSAYPGLVRWSPVEAATSYEVWIFGAKRTFRTTTNVADLRDLYTFRRAQAWSSTVRWRVRAQRSVYGEVASGIPSTSNGPWSPIYTDVQLPPSLGRLTTLAAVSDATSTTQNGTAHSLSPAFAFGGDSGGPLDFSGGLPAELYRVYVATDADCVNIVFRGAVVGSPAYAPRTTGPLALPATSTDVTTARTEALDHGVEVNTLMLDGSPSLTTEAVATAATGAGSGATAAATAAKTELPDTAWPTGGYYWTVVPVQVVPRGVVPAGPNPSYPIEYRETELPQDACQSGRVQRFGKMSPPVLASASRPYASGLSPSGRLMSASRRRPAFYGTPLVAWKPSLGAQEYEVQWSKSAYPWKPVGKLITPATSAMLPLTPGTWHYRVRGYNHGLLKRPQMTWSAPLALKVTKPVFELVRR